MPCARVQFWLPGFNQISHVTPKKLLVAKWLLFLQQQPDELPSVIVVFANKVLLINLNYSSKFLHSMGIIIFDTSVYLPQPNEVNRAIAQMKLSVKRVGGKMQKRTICENNQTLCIKERKY